MDLSFQFGTVAIDASHATKEAPRVQAGGTLYGILRIKAKRNICARELNVYFKGKEYTTVAVASVTNKKERDKHELIRFPLDLPARSSEGYLIINKDIGGIAKGDYKVPFSFEIPETCPPSLKVMQKCGITRKTESAVVKYALRAFVVGSGRIKDYGCTQEVRVISQIIPSESNNIVHCLQREDEKFVGEITLGCKLLDSRVRPDQELHVRCCVVNDSTAPCQSIQVTLQQTLVWWASSSRIKVVPSHQFYSTDKTETLSECTIPYSSEPVGEDSVRRKLQYKMRSYTNQVAIRDLLLNDSDPERVTTVTLPPIPSHAFLNNFQGQKIGVMHQLRIKLFLAIDGVSPLTQVIALD